MIPAALSKLNDVWLRALFEEQSAVRRGLQKEHRIYSGYIRACATVAARAAQVSQFKWCRVLNALHCAAKVNYIVSGPQQVSRQKTSV